MYQFEAPTLNLKFALSSNKKHRHSKLPKDTWQVTISFSHKKHLSQHLYVLHYGPLEGSRNEEEVFSYKHDDTDYSWPEPGPDDPLSLIDQVYF